MSGAPARGRDSFNRYRGVISLLVRALSALPPGIRVKLLERFRKTRGKKGLVLRYLLLKTLARTCGNNVAVFPDVYLLNPQNISIGNNVSIHPMCYIEGGKSKDPAHGVYIGNEVSIAHACTLIPTSHGYTEKEVPIRDQEISNSAVHVGDNVWLGAKVTVLSGVSIASGCVLAAGSVLTKDTQPDGIYAGVPAKRIKNRY